MCKCNGHRGSNSQNKTHSGNHHKNSRHTDIPGNAIIQSQASLCIKQNKPSRNNRGLCLSVVSSPDPLPEKWATGGEDASLLKRSSFGVFDGVGAWRDQGIDSGEYSRALAGYTGFHVDKYGPEEIVDGLKFAFEATALEGSCTACVASLVGKQLFGINIGDSGLIVIRDREIVFKTEAMQHEFNFPYALGRENEKVEDGDRFSFDVESRDIIVSASDGLWDNVHLHDIRRIVYMSMEDYREGNESCWKCAGLKRASRTLALMAKDNATRTTWMSPFATQAKEAGFDYPGGKMDDVTVIVGMVGR